MELEKEIIQVVAHTFTVDTASLHAGTSQADITAWDSLGQLRLIMQLEAHFGVAFSIDEIPGLTSISAIAESIHEKTGR